MSHSCPSCGAEVKLQSKTSYFVVCSSCKSTLQRTDMGLESVGEMADLKDDYSPIQIGTEGSYRGMYFRVIGRLQVAWGHRQSIDGIWNEWHVLFNDGTTGWLSDGQGFYLMVKPTANAVIPDHSSLQLDYTVVIDDKHFTVDDIKHCRLLGSEGELPRLSLAGQELVSIDLVGKGDAGASIVYAGEDREAFVGTYEELEQLRPKGMREFDGW